MKRSQFSLRTLFIVVTILAIPCWYVGAQYRFVHARKQFLQYTNTSSLTEEGSTLTIPWIRKLLGDQSYDSIVTYEILSDEELERIQALFPESEIYRYKRIGGRPSFDLFAPQKN